MDERSQQQIAKGLAITLGIVYISLFSFAIWKYVSTKDISSITWELVFIVMIPASIVWFARRDESLTIPKMISGNLIDTGLSKKSQSKRKKYYFLDSLGFAMVVLILTIITNFFIEKEWQHFPLFPQMSEVSNIIVTLSIEFVISLVVFFTISYVWEEFNIRRYNRKLDELEDNHE
ncbi:hypothetical protein DZB84_09280 [Bacillus sp. HNG]|uniref:hypothetical protein n=1 Tax=Bacillus sp. HNG TaxID=2293325 RepID=UPI000E2F1A14|nr:hypothetical protein [Bacillus sp. HNG]RFB17254.1 hypothetical protein DZB84_09280 [Bacillus sp. HNG]